MINGSAILKRRLGPPGSEAQLLTMVTLQGAFQVRDNSSGDSPALANGQRYGMKEHNPRLSRR